MSRLRKTPRAALLVLIALLALFFGFTAGLLAYSTENDQWVLKAASAVVGVLLVWGAVYVANWTSAWYRLPDGNTLDRRRLRQGLVLIAIGFGVCAVGMTAALLR